MEITFTQKLTDEQIENIIVNALEGGSNYWYFINDATLSLIRRNTKDMNGEPLSLRFVKALDLGCELPIHDYENPNEVLGVISKKTMPERTTNLIDNGYGNHIDDVVNENDDAETADVIFQYWVMNELIFG